MTSSPANTNLIELGGKRFNDFDLDFEDSSSLVLTLVPVFDSATVSSDATSGFSLTINIIHKLGACLSLSKQPLGYLGILQRDSLYLLSLQEKNQR